MPIYEEILWFRWNEVMMESVHLPVNVIIIRNDKNVGAPAEQAIYDRHKKKVTQRDMAGVEQDISSRVSLIAACPTGLSLRKKVA